MSVYATYDMDILNVRTYYISFNTDSLILIVLLLSLIIIIFAQKKQHLVYFYVNPPIPTAKSLNTNNKITANEKLVNKNINP